MVMVAAPEGITTIGKFPARIKSLKDRLMIVHVLYGRARILLLWVALVGQFYVT